jgi:DNA-binding GntR family transcriptional regulator
MRMSAESRPDGLEGIVGILDRATTPQRVADLLRDQILSGRLRSGSQCAEHRLTAALGVSRNTLREAFQVLIAECLLVREPHRGVFVRRLHAADVRDIYDVRRLLACAAVAAATASDAVPDMRAAVEAARRAAAREDWDEVGTADVRFHLAVTASLASQRLDRTMRSLFAELRLAFQLMPDPHELHAPFLDRNEHLLRLVEDGHRREARVEMKRYLDDAERTLLTRLDRG